ncbi:hypothetical protein AK830_g4712 [Neonectria ditissima]|uniref:Uncharacterized protein n=1 Tax=Neonectria ditissima TaxID=78410 RepID=A0A0P7BFK3_9HYPO|nr:hypothetical protein AK830_g4712 [Neonectria ditissima]
MSTSEGSSHAPTPGPQPTHKAEKVTNETLASMWMAIAVEIDDLSVKMDKNMDSFNKNMDSFDKNMDSFYKQANSSVKALNDFAKTSLEGFENLHNKLDSINAGQQNSMRLSMNRQIAITHTNGPFIPLLDRSTVEPIDGFPKTVEELWALEESELDRILIAIGITIRDSYSISMKREILMESFTGSSFKSPNGGSISI